MRSPNAPMLEALLQRARCRRAGAAGGTACYPALVIDIKDPDDQGRVKVTLPWSPDAAARAYEAVGAAGDAAWAATTAAAGSSPTSTTRCWSSSRTATRAGRTWSAACGTAATRRPSRWTAPATTTRRCIRSRNGVKVTLDDQDGQEKLILETPGGQKVTLKDGPGAVEIEDSNGNSIKLESAGITVTASAKVTVNASQVAISAGMVTVDAGMSKFCGVVQADTVISNSVISASYTPGAGNIW